MVLAGTSSRVASPCAGGHLRETNSGRRFLLEGLNLPKGNDFNKANVSVLLQIQHAYMLGNFNHSILCIHMSDILAVF